MKKTGWLKAAVKKSTTELARILVLVLALAEFRLTEWLAGWL